MQRTSQTQFYRSNERGFSLIELMIVVAIISILIVIGNVAFQNAQRTANETARSKICKPSPPSSAASTDCAASSARFSSWLKKD